MCSKLNLPQVRRWLWKEFNSTTIHCVTVYYCCDLFTSDDINFVIMFLFKNHFRHVVYICILPYCGPLVPCHKSDSTKSFVVFTYTWVNFYYCFDLFTSLGPTQIPAPSLLPPSPSAGTSMSTVVISINKVILPRYWHYHWSCCRDVCCNCIDADCIVNSKSVRY